MSAPFSLRDYVAGLAAHVPRLARTFRYGVIAFGVGLVATAIWVLSTQRLYRSEALVMYDRGAQASALGRDAESPRVMAARLTDMVLSRNRISSLIKELNLYPKLVEKRGQVEAIEEMRKRLRVMNSEGYTYRISYDGQAREVAKVVLERLLDSVIKEDVQRRLSEADEAKQFLDAARKQADEDVKQKESALAAFLAKHPQLAAENAGGAVTGGLLRAERASSASGSEIASLELQAAQIEADIIAATGRRPSARSGPTAVLDPSLTAAKIRAETELHAAQADLADKQIRLTNEHPDMKRALRRVADAEAGFRRAEAAIAAWRPPAPSADDTPNPEGEALNARVTALRHALSAVRSQISAARGRSIPRPEGQRTVSSVVAIDTEWTRLNREVSEARERQTQLEGKQFQAQLAATLAAGGQGGRFVMVDPPFKPLRPVAGERFKVGLVGLFGSLLLGFAVIGVIAAFDDRLYGARDVEAVLEQGIVVVIPKGRAKLTAKGS